MKWYAAHLVVYFKLKNRKQRSFPVWENVVLIRARDEDEAFAKAEKRGREELRGDDGSITWGGHPAEMVFAGVRKLVLCEEQNKRPADGTEVSYTEMVLRSEAAIRQLVAGEPVPVVIDEQFAQGLPPRADMQRLAQ